MFQRVLTKTAGIFIPMVIKDLYTKVISPMVNETPVLVAKTPKAVKRAPSDTSTLTIHHYDYILRIHEYWVDTGKKYLPDGKSCRTQNELAEHFNIVFKKYKSSSTYRRVYSGELGNRECFPEGTKEDNSFILRVK